MYTLNDPVSGRINAQQSSDARISALRRNSVSGFIATPLVSFSHLAGRPDLEIGSHFVPMLLSAKTGCVQAARVSVLPRTTAHFLFPYFRRFRSSPSHEKSPFSASSGTPVAPYPLLFHRSVRSGQSRTPTLQAYPCDSSPLKAVYPASHGVP